MRVLILGCGFTGIRVARTFLDTGHDVMVTNRHLLKLRLPGAAQLGLDFSAPGSLSALERALTSESLVLHSLPPVTYDPAPVLTKAHKVVYISTTGVYGSQRDVDVDTPVRPESDRERSRYAVEAALASVTNLLVLRPAAIYGPNRGIHASMREGKYKMMGDGSNYVSRIHVDDLAAHCAAGLLSDLTGAWPVGDEEPCRSREIAEFCATLLQLPLPPSVPAQDLTETRRSDRRVDGSAIRKALDIRLRYLSYRVGIPACIAEEERAMADTRAF